MAAYPWDERIQLSPQPNYMMDLAQGLRAAAGVLNPDIQRQTFASDERAQAVMEQRRNLAAQQIIRAAENGAMEPEAAKIQLQRLGFGQLPVGPSLETQAKTQALKNEQGFRDEMQRIGPNADLGEIAKVATKYGKPEIAAQMFKAQEDRALRAETARQTLEMKRSQLDQTRELALMRAQNDQERTAIDRQYKEGRLAIDSQLAAIRGQSLGLQSQMLQLRLHELGRKEDEDTQKKVSQLGQRIETAKLNEADATLGNVETAIEKNPKILEYATGPGSLRPDFSLPTNIALGRQAIEKLFNIELKNRSGAAVTIPEFERLKTEYAKGVFKTPAQLKGAIEQARGILNNHYRGIVAGYEPRILNLYNENLKAVGGTPIIIPTAKEPPKPAAPKPGDKPTADDFFR